MGSYKWFDGFSHSNHTHLSMQCMCVRAFSIRENLVCTAQQRFHSRKCIYKYTRFLSIDRRYCFCCWLLLESAHSENQFFICVRFKDISFYLLLNRKETKKIKIVLCVNGNFILWTNWKNEKSSFAKREKREETMRQTAFYELQKYFSQ